MIRLLTTVVLLLALISCADEGGDDVDGLEAKATLEQQRVDVRDAARTMLQDTERILFGTTANSVGRWDGCESTFNDEFKNFQYVAQARVDAAPDAPRPFLEALRPVLESAGFTAGAEETASDRATLKATKDDLTAVFLDTGGPFVGLDVYGPCVDVPEDEREDWLRRAEPTPQLL